jgi:hypothetical protein
MQGLKARNICNRVRHTKVVPLYKAPALGTFSIRLNLFPKNTIGLHLRL